MAQGIEIEQGTFAISGPRDKCIKLLSNERIDAEFLCRIFDVKSEDILGLRTQNDILIRLDNPRLNETIDGKLCTLEIYSQSPPAKKRKLSNSSSKVVTNETENEDEQSKESSEDLPIVRDLPEDTKRKSYVYKLKSPKSAWILFNTFKQKQLMRNSPGISFGRRAKKSAKIWQRMNENEKAGWRRKALKEKEKYQRLKEEFDEHQDYTKIPASWLKTIIVRKPPAESDIEL